MCSRGGQEESIRYFLILDLKSYPCRSDLTLYSKIICVGYWLGGFGFGESMEERPSLLQAVTVSLISLNLSCLVVFALH